MNPYVCALTLILSCGSKPAVALNVGSGVVAFADVYYTQRSFSLCRNTGRCWQLEANPLTRPFQSHGQTFAFQSSFVGQSLLVYTVQKMRNSRNRVLRRIWWLPQGALIGASLYGSYTQVRDYRAALSR